jgi:hypothetical protein
MKKYHIEVDNDLQIVRVTAFGILYQKDGYKIISEARKVAAQHQYPILYDIREATTKVPLVAYFRLPRELDVFKDVKTRFVKVAIVISENEDPKVYKFYQTVMQNIGLELCVFKDMALAERYLKDADQECV